MTGYRGDCSASQSVQFSPTVRQRVAAVSTSDSSLTSRHTTWCSSGDGGRQQGPMRRSPRATLCRRWHYGLDVPEIHEAVGIGCKFWKLAFIKMLGCCYWNVWELFWGWYWTWILHERCIPWPHLDNRHMSHRWGWNLAWRRRPKKPAIVKLMLLIYSFQFRSAFRATTTPSQPRQLLSQTHSWAHLWN